MPLLWLINLLGLSAAVKATLEPLCVSPDTSALLSTLGITNVSQDQLRLRLQFRLLGVEVASLNGSAWMNLLQNGVPSFLAPLVKTTLSRLSARSMCVHP